MSRDDESTHLDAALAAHAATAAIEPRGTGELSPLEAPAKPGTLDRYRLAGLIGRGGMGEVVSAMDRQIGREVAIKRIRADGSGSANTRRFLREARIQGRLEHPAIVPVHELSNDDDGQPYFVMKKLSGKTLAEMLAAGAVSRQRLLRAFADVCLAIEFAHTRGVVHRDLKPANIVLGDFGEVYVLDWGVARVRDDGPEGDGERPSIDSIDLPPGALDMTAAGTLLGTPGYMSPEQVQGSAEIDGRADVYALGAILFEILAGVPLHPPGMPALPSTLAGGDARPSVRSPERGIPPELDSVVARACALVPADRVATARELAERVTAYLDGDRDVATRKKLALAHLERARTAIAATGENRDERARRRALREASSAFALDPTADEAAHLVTGLMLTPPTETPAEVETALANLDADVARAQARLGTVAILGYLAFLPVLFAIGVRDMTYVFAWVALVGLGAASTFVLAHSRVIGAPVVAGVLIGQVALVVLFARVFSPFVIAPGVAGTTLMAMAQQPRFGKLWLMWGLMTAGVIAPFILEQVGVLSPTMEFIDAHLVLHSPALLLHPLASEIGLSIYVPVMLYVAVKFTRQNALAQRDARRLIEIQKWQLRQLMPVGPNVTRSGQFS